MALVPPLDRCEPMPRYQHASAQVGNKVLVYSGVTRDYSERGRQRLASLVEVFDSKTELWEAKQTTGESPVPGVWTTASTSVDDDLFMYGGLDSNRQPLNSLHRLNTKTYHWSKLAPRTDGKDQFPMAKFDAAMVACGNNLALFGGRGVPHDPTQLGSSFIKSAKSGTGSGWTNEFHIYNLKDGMPIEYAACLHSFLIGYPKYAMVKCTYVHIELHVVCSMFHSIHHSALLLL